MSKWGNSLAIRIPAAVVEALNLKEGNNVQITLAGKRDFRIDRDHSREEALQRLRNSRWKILPGFKFDREEANER